MPKESMTPRERWLAVLNREKPDRVPMDYWATPEATAKLMKHLGCATQREVMQKLHIDRVVRVAPDYVGPPLPEKGDVFQRVFREVRHATGAYRECVRHPLASFRSVEEIRQNYRWPEPDWWDYGRLSEQIRGGQDDPVQGGGSEPFLIYCELRGQEQALMDLVLHPDMVHYCLDRLFHLAYEDTRRVFEALPGRVLLCYVAEDMGTQDSLLFSPDLIREFLLPRMKGMIDLAHEAGAFVFHHNDGYCRPVLPDLVEAGIDLLNPIQWKIPGMDREGLKRDFGRRVVFHGGVDNQYTLPFGTVDEVRREVLDNLRILGEGGGYILAPCHNLQAVGPPENIVALYETGFAHGWT
jgi:uroporphyrinogen decarboxylase